MISKTRILLLILISLFLVVIPSMAWEQQPLNTSQWLDSYIATVFRSDNFFAGSSVEGLLNTVTPGQFQILLVIAAFIGLMMWEDKGRKNKYN